MPLPVILPKFGFTLETSDIVGWLKQEGDTVRAGDPICEVTTDKVNMEVEAPEAGTLWGILYQPGETVKVTDVICYLLKPGEAPPAERPTKDGASVSVEALPVTPLQNEPTSSEPAQPAAVVSGVAITPVARRVAESANVDLQRVQGSGPGGRILKSDVEQVLTQPPGKVRATPAARHLVAEAGVALENVRGTGPQGRIQGTDVQAYIDALEAAPDTSEVVESVGARRALPLHETASLNGEAPQIIKIEGMRRTIATRLQKSFQTAPHIFVEMQIDTAAIDALRARLKAKKQKLSVTSILVKACAWALKRHPYVNATTDGETIQLWPTANIGVAVALDNGLIVPVVHHAERLGMGDIQTKIDDLVERARNNKLQVNDMMDGTFTISNLGMFGVDRFTAIINPPQVAILAVGRTVQQFVPDENGQPILKSTMAVTLSADHRVVDGAVAAQFLQDLRDALEDPALLAW
jgi:pyruvate dehydrogenase E2 component (dihydrolipoamide acetyltransferase)